MDGLVRDRISAHGMACIVPGQPHLVGHRHPERGEPFVEPPIELCPPGFDLGLDGVPNGLHLPIVQPGGHRRADRAESSHESVADIEDQRLRCGPDHDGSRLQATRLERVHPLLQVGEGDRPGCQERANRRQVALGVVRVTTEVAEGAAADLRQVHERRRGVREVVPPGEDAQAEEVSPNREERLLVLKGTNGQSSGGLVQDRACLEVFGLLVFITDLKQIPAVSRSHLWALVVPSERALSHPASGPWPWSKSTGRRCPETKLIPQGFIRA